MVTGRWIFLSLPELKKIRICPREYKMECFVTFESGQERDEMFVSVSRVRKSAEDGSFLIKCLFVIFFQYLDGEDIPLMSPSHQYYAT